VCVLQNTTGLWPGQSFSFGPTPPVRRRFLLHFLVKLWVRRLRILASLGFLLAVGEQAQHRDVLNRTLLRSFWERMAAGVPYAEDRTLEEVHHSFLLVVIGLVGKVVERQNR
jgi:hypothetical protein